jgi:GT2 family glycosyltransferase/MoaA/NifB/PqqE/SkfB family radical SAM enzyme
MDEMLIKDGKLVENKIEITTLREELSGLAEQAANNLVNIEDKGKEIELLKNELGGIYNSEGFRFILRPIWTALYEARGLSRLAGLVLRRSFWFMVSVALTPVFLFLSLFFVLEHIIWVIFAPLLRKIAPKRKLVSIKDGKISLVIPNYNGIACLSECLPSVFAAQGFTDGQNEVLVVDDGSKDDSVDFIKNNFPSVRLIQNKKNKGFGFTCNRGIKAARNEIIVLINNDIILTKDFLAPLLAHLEDESVFAVTPKLYAWDKKTFVWGMHMGHFEKGYVRLWNESETGNGDRVHHASPTIFAIGGAMAFRKRDFLWLGGFDGIYRPNCWEDIDISYHAWKRGLKVIYEPSSMMFHKGRATLTYERPKEIKNELLFTWKNITDARILKNHLNLLPWNLYCNGADFLKGLFWALNYIPQAMLHRLLCRAFTLEFNDRKIFNKVMLNYKNFCKRRFKDPAREKPNVLIISRFLPYPLNAGGKIRIHTLVKLLADRYNFILLSLFDHENELQYIPKLKEVFTEVYPVIARSPWNMNFSSQPFYPNLYKIGYSYNEDLIDKLKEIENERPVDIVHIESNELLYLLDYLKYTPAVYTEHDISILSLRDSYYKKKNIFSFFDHLKKVHFHFSQFKKSDKIITLSREDEKILKEFSPEADINLIPTGVNLQHFSLNVNPKGANKLVFVGHYRHYPNEDAMVYFAKKVFPLIRKKVPEAELLLVGSDPTEAIKDISRNKNIRLIGGVADVKPYLDKADVFVNYIRKSAGIKGKVLEAMAVGVPVVSTKSGSSGINAKPEKEILFADSPRGFARQVIRLLKDEGLRKKIVSNARVLAENEYDWIKIKDKLDKLYRSMLSVASLEGTDDPLIDKIIDNANSYVEHKINKLNGNLIKPQDGPEELHLELTYNCNSRCIMCDLWDYNSRSVRKGCHELSLDEIRHFVEGSRMLRNLKTVVFSGGEPFLRHDLVDLCGFFSKYSPDASIGILTNGLDTETILSKGKEVLDKFSPKSLWLGSSLDGIGQEHDRIRGKEGAFTALQKTIERCKKELPGVDLSTTFTLTPYNVGQLIPAKEFADSEGTHFYAQFVVPKEARGEFVWTPQNLNFAEKEIKRVIRDIVNKADKQTLLNAIDKVKEKNVIPDLYYWSHLLSYQTSPQRFFKKCVSGGKFAMFNPYGDLFFCPTHKNISIGNIKEENFDDLWMSQKAEHMRNFIKEGNCHCWLVCIVFPVLEKALSS